MLALAEASCCTAKPVIVLGQLLVEGGLQETRMHTAEDLGLLLLPIWGINPEQAACVLSRRPKFHNFPRIPAQSQVIYSFVIHKVPTKTHEERGPSRPLHRTPLNPKN